MKLSILCVGKIRESFYRDAVAEYTKRLSRYASLSILEVADEPTPDRAGAAARQRILDTEASRLGRQLHPSARVVALDIRGEKMDSVSFAAWLERQAIEGCAEISFIIGGSLGLSDSILNRADLKLSFSDMTFPHQLMRVILLEQIYRSYRIINGEPYHK